MPNIFGANIDKRIATALSSKVFDVVLISVVPGTRTPGALTAGTNSTETSSTVKGFVDVHKGRHVVAEDGTLVERGDRVVAILGGTLPTGTVPKVNDKVTAEGTTLRIVHVERDPAGAVYECAVR